MPKSKEILFRTKNGGRTYEGQRGNLIFELVDVRGVDAVHSALIRQKIKCDRDQAERVSWRIVKDWVEAQMAILESEMVQMDEIFLPYMLNGSGHTLFEAYRSNQLALEGGDQP